MVFHSQQQWRKNNCVWNLMWQWKKNKITGWWSKGSDRSEMELVLKEGNKVSFQNLAYLTDPDPSRSLSLCHASTMSHSLFSPQNYMDMFRKKKMVETAWCHRGCKLISGWKLQVDWSHLSFIQMQKQTLFIKMRHKGMWQNGCIWKPRNDKRLKYCDWQPHFWDCPK